MSKANKVELISVRLVLALINVAVPYNSFLTKNDSSNKELIFKRERHVRKTKDR